MTSNMRVLKLAMLLLSLTSVLATCPAEMNIVQWEETEVSATPIIKYCPNAPSSPLIRFCTDAGWSSITGSCPVSPCATETIEDRIWPETQPGETATVNCPAGQSGTYSRVCSSEGVWGSETNNCVVLTCSADDPWPQTNAGETASLTCPVGTVGNHTRLCNLSGVWEAEVNNCHAPVCPEENYEGILYPETAANTPATVPCPAGQTGFYIRLCNVDGTWSTPTNTCVASFCPAEVYEGIEYPQTALNTPAVVDCPAGQTGSYIRLCDANGTWGTPMNTCAAITCAADDPWPQTNAGVTASLDCPAGTTGTRTRLCNLSGVWEAEVNTCAATSCPEDTYEGVLYPETAANTPATVPCPAGQTGFYIRLCGANGIWSVPTNTCAAITCAADDPWPQTNAGETASVDCPAGTTGTRTRLCNINGIWETEVNTCSATSCPEDTYEGILYPQTPVNTPATVPCPAGQTGSYIRLCNASGTWNAPTNTCAAITCAADDPWPLTNAGVTASVDCPAGSTGSRTRLCNINGVWEAEVNTCSI